MTEQTEAQAIAAELTAKMAEALVAFQESHLAALLDAVAGYRQRCLEASFSPTAAEQMSLEYHRFLISKLYGVAVAL